MNDCRSAARHSTEPGLQASFLFFGEFGPGFSASHIPHGPLLELTLIMIFILLKYKNNYFIPILISIVIRKSLS